MALRSLASTLAGLQKACGLLSLLLVLSGTEARFLASPGYSPEVSAAPVQAAPLRALEQLNAALAGSPDAPTIVWQRCKLAGELGEVCVGVFLYQGKAGVSAVGVELQLLNTTYYLPVLQSMACLNEVVILHLLLQDPAFAQYAPMIQKLILLEHALGAEVASACIIFSQVHLNAASISACSTLDSDFACYRKRCLFKKVEDFGCFDIPLPHNQGLDRSIFESPTIVT